MGERPRTLLRWAWNGSAVLSAVLFAALSAACAASYCDTWVHKATTPGGDSVYWISGGGALRRLVVRHSQAQPTTRPFGAWASPDVRAGGVEWRRGHVVVEVPLGSDDPPTIVPFRSAGIHYAYLALPAAVLPSIRLAARARSRRRVARGLCPACGYDLRATPGRCPECGTEPAR